MLHHLILQKAAKSFWFAVAMAYYGLFNGSKYFVSFFFFSEAPHVTHVMYIITCSRYNELEAFHLIFFFNFESISLLVTLFKTPSFLISHLIKVFLILILRKKENVCFSLYLYTVNITACVLSYNILFMAFQHFNK